MKRFFKWIGTGLLIILLAGGAFAAHEWYADKPFYFNNLLNREMVKVAFDSPETLTSLGFLESVGIKGHNAELDDASIEKNAALFDKARHIRERVLAYDDEDLNDDEQLSKEITLYLLDYLISNEPFQYHSYPVNQLFGVQNGFPSFMEGQHQINDATDVENYLSRLRAVDEKFAQVLEGLKLREEKGIIPPRFVIDRVLDEMNGFISSPIEENILYSSLKEKMSKAEEISAEQQDAFLAEAQTVIGDDVDRAYQLFIDYFTTLQAKAGNDHGYWHLPDGDKVYANALRFFTTTDMTADEIHNLGFKRGSKNSGRNVDYSCW